MEKEIKIAAKLYDCRDAAKSYAKIIQRDYKQLLEPYTAIVKATMKANNLDELKAVLKISQTQTFQESGTVQMLFFAATVELIEPSV